MRPFLPIFATLLSISVAGCASMGPKAPPADQLARLPLVSYGEKADPNQDHIVFFPAGKPVPLEAVFKGNMFAKETTSVAEPVLSRDVYLYKQWVSFDRKTWVSGREAFRVLVNVSLPTYESPGSGVVSMQLDALK